MKNWIIPVALIIFVLVGSLIVWMVTGEPTYLSNQMAAQPVTSYNGVPHPSETQNNSGTAQNVGASPAIQQNYPMSNPVYQGTEKLISNQAESFTIDASLQGQIEDVREVFPSLLGDWQSFLYYGQNKEFTSSGGLPPGDVKLFFDVQLKNTSRSETISINFPTMFKLEDGGATIYDDRANSNNSDSKLTLLPLQSATESLWFTIPSSTQTINFWYGPNTTDFVDGFTVMFNTGKIASFRG